MKRAMNPEGQGVGTWGREPSAGPTWLAASARVLPDPGDSEHRLWSASDFVPFP